MLIISNKNYFNKLKKRKKLFFLLVFFSYSSVVFFSGILINRYKLLRPAYGFLTTNVKVPYYFLKSLNSKKENLNLDIKYKHFSKIEDQVSISQKLEHLYVTKDDWVPAKAKINNSEYSY